MIAEKIYFVPNCNENEVLRELAKNGINSFNSRIVNTNELIERMLLSKGISYTYPIISDSDAVYLIADIIINQKKCTSLKINNFEDCKSVFNSLGMYRKLLIGIDEEKLIEESLDLNQQKNSALIELYTEYKNQLSIKCMKDNIDYLRDAIQLYSTSKNDGLNNVEYFTLKEFILSPLEQELLRIASNNSFNDISISDLYPNVMINDGKVRYSSGYGITSEVKSIIDYIYKNNISIDQCVIATTNYPIYSEQFLEYGRQYNINITFENGILITNTNPAAFLKLLLNWKRNKYNYDSLYALVNSSCFNKEELCKQIGCKDDKFNEAIEVASGLRISNNGLTQVIDDYELELEKRIKFYDSLVPQDGNDEAKRNGLVKIKNDLHIVRKIAKLLNGDFSYLLKKFCKIRDGYFEKYDTTALIKLVNQLEELYKIFDDDNELTITSLFKELVCGKVSSPGALHITTLKGALAIPRKNIFICGLSSKYFPGKLQEDPFFYDSDLLKFGNNINIPNAKNSFLSKKYELKNLLDLALKLGSNINVSYTRYDTKDYKALNPSADIYDLFNRLNPKAQYKDYKNAFEKYEYAVNIEYLSKDDLSKGMPSISLNNTVDLFDRYYSPSAIKNYITCPRMFFLNDVMKLSIDEEDDNNKIIASNDFGTLLHEQARLYMNGRFNCDADFLTNSEDSFDLFIKGRVVGTKQETASEKLRYMDMIRTLLNMIKSYSLISTEQKLYGKYKYDLSLQNGGKKEYILKLKGQTDLICKDNATGDTVIVDYKTGKSSSFEENDPISCIQGLLYASMYNKNGKVEFDFLEANKCSFLFLKENKVVSCPNTKAAIDQIKKDVLNPMINDLINNNFKAKENDFCKHCKYATFCGK